MDIIYGILWILVAIVSSTILVVFIGWLRGALDWDDIKKMAKAVKEFFWSSTLPAPSPTPVSGSDWNFHFKKAGIITTLVIVYIGTLVAFFILGVVISRLYNPWAGWPVFLFLSAIFVAKNSKTVPVGKFAHLLFWGFQTDIRLRTGTYPIPFLDWLVTFEEYSTEKIPIILTIENIPLPDGTKATAVIKGESVIHDIVKYTEIGGAAGMQRNLMTRAEPCVKDYFQSREYGPQTHQEAEAVCAKVLPSVLKTLIGNKQLPKIPSVIPTSVLLDYFNEPRQKPTPAEANRWGENWENMVLLLPTNPADLTKLKTALEERKEAIASLSNGTAHFIDQATGTAFEAFAFDSITILGGIPEETAKAAKEVARGKALLAGVNDSIAQAKAVVEATEKIFGIPFTPEQKIELFQRELKKVMVDLKMVSSDKSVMYIIPGLTEIVQAGMQLLQNRNGGSSQQITDLETRITELEAMIAAATAPAGTP